MDKFLIKNNIPLISRICLAGLFIALATILQKVIAINYIAAVPFLRISLGGPAVIIFASILLGPWFGLLVGAASDLLGFLIFDASGMGFFPQITAIYALLGFASYFAFCLIRFIKNKKVMLIVEVIGMVAICLAASLYVVLAKELKLYGSTYTLEVWQKILIPIILFVLMGVVLFFVILFDKKNKKMENELPLNAYQISFALLIIEVVVMVLFGTLMKGIAFGFATYPMILICQIIVLFFNVPLNTALISLMLKVVRKRFSK